jgi:transcriptional antiterminator NusG
VTEESNTPIDDANLPQNDESAQDDVTEIQQGTIADMPLEQPSCELEAANETADEPAPDAAEAEMPDQAEEVSESAEASRDDTAEPEATPEPVPPAPEESLPAEEHDTEERKMDWYILKVQSNREDTIRDGLIRRVKIAGLEEYFGEVIVPTEKVTEFKGGKKRVMKRKLYPGYIVVNMEINDDTWFLVRETPGIGDFTGAAGTPTAMLPHEVQRILAKKEEKQDEVPKLDIGFHVGDQVKINEGTFENFEGEVHTIDKTNGRVTVMINIFGRSTPVELEYWQIESV